MRALIFHGVGRDTTVRPECFRRMVSPLLDHAVSRLVIESRQGRDHADRQVLLDALRGRGSDMTYDHMPPYSDPILWAADSIAWCASAGGV